MHGDLSWRDCRIGMTDFIDEENLYSPISSLRPLRLCGEKVF